MRDIASVAVLVIVLVLEVVGEPIPCDSPTQRVFMREDWEGCSWETPYGAWTDSANAAWQICDSDLCPPDSARSGTCYIGAPIDGGVWKTMWLISPPIVIDETEMEYGEVLVLKYWNWYVLGNCGYYKGCCWGTSKNDTAYVAVRPSGGTWLDVQQHVCYSAGWACEVVDLSAFNGQVIQIGFRLRENCGCDPQEGWFIDDISLEIIDTACGDFTLSAGPDRLVCAGDSVSISDITVECGIAPYTYEWSPCTGLDECGIPNPRACPDTTITYVLSITDASNPPKSDSDSTTVSVVPPIVDLHAVSLQSSEQLCIEPLMEFDSCLWASGQSTCAICTTIVDTGIHLLAVRAFINGCVADDTVEVYVDPVPTDAPLYEPLLPSEPMVLHAYPNPFNATAKVSYCVPRRCVAVLSVYDLLGRRVRTLVHRVQNAGMHETAWDGTDTFGQRVASGVYFLSLSACGRVLTAKMALLK